MWRAGPSYEFFRRAVARAMHLHAAMARHRRRKSSAIDAIVARNVRAIAAMRHREDVRRTREQRVADAVSRIAGSMKFVYAHVVLFTVWILINVDAIPGVPIVDPFPFVLLTTIVSLEAIILTSMVLVSQNRMQRLDAERNELDLQIDLLAEHEVTRILRRVEAIARDHGIELDDGDIEALEQEIAPSHILRAIAAANGRRLPTENDDAGDELDLDAGESYH